jgi:spore coat polysaccharide biosynthesis protein SpsF
MRMNQKSQRIVAVVEARMTSSRLPGKVLLEAMDKPMLGHLVLRLQAVPSLDEIVIATTVNDTDQAIVEFARDIGVLSFRGSEDDVMSRVIGAAEHADADVIVEITGDCPIIDPDIVEQGVRMFKYNDAAYVSNAHIRSYPDGMDVQVFTLESLKKSASLTINAQDREHVSLHMRSNPKMFPPLHLVAPPSQYWPELGLTLDEKFDYEILKKIIECLGKDDILFDCSSVIELLRCNPDWVEINSQVIRKGGS